MALDVGSAVDAGTFARRVGVADEGSIVDVEQINGRILSQPELEKQSLNNKQQEILVLLKSWKEPTLDKLRDFKELRLLKCSQ